MALAGRIDMAMSVLHKALAGSFGDGGGMMTMGDDYNGNEIPSVLFDTGWFDVTPEELAYLKRLREDTETPHREEQ